MELVKQIKEAEAQAEEIIKQAKAKSAGQAEEAKAEHDRQLEQAELERKRVIAEAVAEVESAVLVELEGLKTRGERARAELQKKAQAKMDNAVAIIMKYVKSLSSNIQD